MIYQEVSVSMFRDAFIRYDRNVFSYAGYEALFNYLESVDDWVELDVIALCCDYCELSFDEVKEDYQLDEELSDADVINWLEDQTSVVYVGDNTVMFGMF